MKPENQPGLDIAGIRLVTEARLYSDREITSPDDAVLLLAEKMKDLDREIVMAVYLRPDGKPVCASFISVGTLENSLVHPREIFKTAVLCNAESMILIHNHPCCGTASDEDIDVTNRLVRCGHLMGIPLVDHVVVQGRSGEFLSLRYDTRCDFSPDEYSCVAAQKAVRYGRR